LPGRAGYIEHRTEEQAGPSQTHHDMLTLHDLHFRAGGRPVLQGAGAQIARGWKVGLVGRNGAGKTTLLKLIAGELEADAGSIDFPRGWRLGHVNQEAPGGDVTPLQHVLAADRERERLLAERDATPHPERQLEVAERLAAIGAEAAPARAAALLAGLGFDQAAQTRPLGRFSGGWRMRVALAAMLFAEPDLLLLDEPTNYLDLEAAMWLEARLKATRGSLLLVSHDRGLLNRVPDAILHLEAGRTELYRDNYDSFVRARVERLAQQDKLRQRQEAERQRLTAFIERFRAKASKAAQAQSRVKALARLQPVAAAASEPPIVFRLPPTRPPAPPLLRLEGVAIGYGEGEPVLRRLDLRIDPDDRIALLGRNGNGKSTLLRLLAGRMAARQGTLNSAPGLRIGYFAQHQIEDLDPADTPVRHLARLLPRASDLRLRTALGGFAFSAEKADTEIASLSGGERARLVLAGLAAGDPHLLLLDEPSNHLDIESREALADALNDYGGAVVMVTHDRHLIELVADRLWLAEGGGVRPFEGDLDAYEADVLAAARPPTVAGERGGAGEKRRQQRRDAAEQRQRLAPLRRQLREAEAMAQTSHAALAAIDKALAEPGTYAEPHRARRLREDRAQRQRALADAEATWLAAAEALEAAEAESEPGG